MDPLSITVSVLALASAVAACLNKIKTLKGAPKEIQSLVDEISDLRIVLQEVTNSLTHRGEASDAVGEPTDLETTENLSSLLFRSKDKLVQLDEILNQKLLVTNPKSGQLKYAKTSWVKFQSKVEGIKKELTTLKLSLVTVIGASTSTEISKIHIKLEEIMKVARARSSNQEQVNREQTVEVGSIGDDNLELATSAIARQIPTSTPQDLFSLLQGKGSNSTCPKWCSCICHRPKHLSTPRLLQAAIGCLSVGYTCIPFTTQPCNQTMCRPQHARSTRIIYQFPNWILMRAVSVLITSNAAGPELLLRTLRVLPGNAEIFRLATAGDLEGMKNMFSSGKASVHDVDDRRWSLLHKSYLVGQEEVVKFLLDQGADVNLEADNRSSVVERAWYTDRTSTGSLSLNHDYVFRHIDIQELAETQHYSILHKIILGLSSLDLESQLEISTAEIESPDTRGRTPLWWASARGDREAVKVLLKYGAFANAKSDNSFTPLHSAKIAPVARLLLEAGAAVDDQDSVGRTPLHVCTYRGDYRSGTTDILSVLLDFGAEINRRKKSGDGQTALHYTATYGFVNHATVLLNRGADIEARMKNGHTPLMEAVRHSKSDFVELLLQHNADYRAISSNKTTILHLCAANGDLNTTEVLTGKLKGLDVNAMDTYGFTCREYLQQRQNATDDIRNAFEALLRSVGDNEEEEFEDAVESQGA